MTQVEITNFQSIKHAIFEFEGFTTIVGSNYIGKSAILRAINAALTNRSGVDFIRWGESFCEVKIKRPGLDLLWHKEEGHNFYVINKQRYDKIGRGEVPPILETLRYNPVKVGTEKLDLLYADQFNPLFMVDRRGATSTDLLTSIYKLDQIYKAKELCDKDLKVNKGLIGFKEKDLAFSEAGVKRISSFPEVKEHFGRLDAKKKEIGSIEIDIAMLKGFIQKLSDITDKLKKLKLVEKIEITAEGTLVSIKEEVSHLSSLKSRLETQALSINRLKFISTLPDISTEPLDRKSSDLISLRLFVDKITVCATQVRRLSTVNSTIVGEVDPKLENYQKTVDLLKSFSSRLYDVSISLRSISSIKQVEIKETPSLDFSILSKLDSFKSKMIKNVEEISTLRTALKQVDEDLEDVTCSLEKYPNCPACGSQVEHAHN